MTTQHQLMKRGEREVARILRNECCRPGGDAQLNDFLNYLLDPSKQLDDADRLRWCRALIAGDASFDEYARTVSSYDDAAVCGLVWTADFVAYRCRTCGISPCMSLCADCFHAADHTGHDFNMFRSQAGGACDCGDVSVMRSIGFCTKHGPNRHTRPDVPAELVAMPTLMMGKLIIRLVQHLREYCPVEMHGSYSVSMPEGEAFIDFLQQLSDMGAVMKTVIAKTVTDPELYANFVHGGLESNSYHAQSNVNYRNAVETMTSVPVPEEFKDVEMLTQPLKHSSLLDELFFWAIKYELPQKLATFLLSLLPNDPFKEAFTLTFVRHYGCITQTLMNVLDKSRMANRVVHISVQLLSPPLLAYKMVTDYQLLHIVLASMRHMVDSVLSVDGGPDPDSNHQFVDCSQQLLIEHSYWPIVSDLINLLAHREVALYFMNDKRLLKFWAKLISCFQGMNTNVRELKQHVVYEPESYYAAFSAELEICASIMWSLVLHLNDKSTASYTKNVLEVFVQALKDWFTATRTSRFTVPYSLQMSFHYPLHRYFAVFVHNAVNVQQVDLDDVLPSISFLHMLMIHPLHLMVCFNEIHAGMWVRNGHQIRGQAMTYVQSHFCNSTIDADIYLLQLVSSQLDPDYVVHTVLDRFGVLNLLTFSQSAIHVRSRHLYRERDHEMPMLESALAFLSILLGERLNLGMSQSGVTAREMITLLAGQDRTHSQLMDALPEKCGLSGVTKDYEPILAQVSDFKTPAPVFEPGGSMQQGKYVLKGSSWLNEYDPLHVLLRAVNRREVQISLDRFTQYVKQLGLYKGSSNPWPPFRVPAQPYESYVGLNKLLHCRSMHAALFTLLYKSVNQKTLPEAIVYYTIHLLDLAVSVPNPDAGRKKVLIEDKQLDLQFSHWFAVDCIFTNACIVITNVTVEEFQPSSSEVSLSFSSAFAATDDDDDDDVDLSAVMPIESVVPAASASSASMATASAASSKMGLVPVAGDGKALATPGEDSETSPSRRSCGVTANLNLVTTVDVPVNESMLTLLLSLLERFSPSKSRAAYHFSQADAQSNVQSRVGGADFFIRKVLDKICLESGQCREAVCSLSQQQASADHVPTGESDTHKDNEAERRRKAKQRQEKLMKEFASKQKRFMEKVVSSADNDIAGSGISSSAASAGSHDRIDDAVTDGLRIYDCCICTQSMQSTSDRLFGLVALLQPTSLLGHRHRQPEASSLPVSDSVSLGRDTTYAKAFHQRFRQLTSQFDETSCILSQNIGWEGGVHAQTCGHYLHLDCHRSYVSALKSQAQSSRGLRVGDGEFWCPLCRQLSNSVLPILPDDISRCEDATSDQPPNIVQHVAELLLRPASCARSRNVKEALDSVMDDLTSATIAVHRMLIQNNEMSPFVFVCSILRTNLELEIDVRGGSPCLPTNSSKKSCIPLLFQILNANSKMLLQRSQAELWSQITGFTPDRESYSLSVYHEEVPLLLRDVTCLFIQLVLSLPLPISKAVYQFVVRSLYNVNLVQFAASLAYQFTSDERQSWQTMGHMSTCHDLELLVSRVIDLFDQLSLAPHDGYSHGPSHRAICSEVWSPINAESARVHHVLPFLRVAALLQFHLFGDELPSIAKHAMNGGEELTALALYTGLSASVDSLTPSLDPMDDSRWHGVASNVIGDAPVESWCHHLARRRADSESESRIGTLLTINPIWYPAELLQLPRQYEQIFDFYRKRRCAKCDKIPKNPALCLVCGQLVCYKGDCCSYSSRYECVQHSIVCGSSTGVFLNVNSSVIIIIRGVRATIWGSVYLDAHGEEDRELKRGKPLHLSVERYRVLQNLWMSHSIDHVCKQWVFHNNNI